MWKTTVYGSRDVELRLPISRNVALLCGHRLVRDGFYFSFGPVNIRDFNKHTVIHAARFVWADRKSPTISGLVRKYSPDDEAPVRRR